MAYAVTAIDVGCDCCSYVLVDYFTSKAEAEQFITTRTNPDNYVIDDCDEEDG